ncbi:hypothetical protein GJU43_06535 [Flavobacterium sp. LC2016-23]|uniref:hypothetical protein n=1 Tax=Flavobacterium sp. LC2016-23 TaxID=2666330 RepID=UPI0012B0A59F|nr:hypothetical protein [Flavobacterium sp. LC2016-23]MRX38924.1 hypothetical protein [Flavobacterium sp. LC2016-23]
MINITKKIALVLFVCGTVFTSCSSDDKNENEVVDTATLKTFKDVTFSLDEEEGFTATRFFSTETGKSYKKTQIDATILPKIDIAFYGENSSLNYFVSPNDPDDGILKATTTDYINYVKDQYTIDQFNKLENGADLNGLTIVDDGETFPDNKLPLLVLFKNAAGKKGVIYVKSVHRVGGDPRIVVDIKIQK